MKLKTTCLATMIGLASCFSINTAFAGDSIADLTMCITDSTSGKDRRHLATWVFTAMSIHPEITAISSITPEVRKDSEARAGKIFNRLLTEDCLAEVQTNIDQGKPQSIKVAFEKLGRLAMQELMSDPNVLKAFEAPAKYVDASKLKAPPAK